MISSVVLFLMLLTPPPATAPLHFYPDDPVRVDQDRLDTPEKPAVIELSDLFDRFSHIVHDFGGDSGEAENVNTLDEVPDSSWFTNRHGSRRLPIERLVAGPNTDEGPVLPWTIVKTKVQGLTPGFHIVDASGQRFVIKLDARAAPEVSSASEIIATRILHAIGYNVPENYLVLVHDEDLRIQPGTLLVDRFGDRMRLTRKRLSRILKLASRTADGRIRAVASRYIEGEPLGPFRYHGTRSDDPNDVIPHENRRELRGLRVFAAWLNHDDTRAQNTLDTWVEENGRHFVRHYLIDFGSTMGSGTVDLQLPNLGFHYWLDPDVLKKSAVSFGFYTPPYRKVRWPEQTRLPGVGRFESTAFDPGEWKNDYPNPAFVRMTSRDGFWAAKILLSFTEAELESIVRTGQLSHPEAEKYILETLIHRQRKTAAHFLNQLNPLAEFRLLNDGLEFTNLAEEHRLGPAGSEYRFRWFLYENLTGQRWPLAQDGVRKMTRIELPRVNSHEAGRFLMVEIETLNGAQKEWKKKVGVYLQPVDGHYRVVGIDRKP